MSLAASEDGSELLGEVLSLDLATPGGPAPRVRPRRHTESLRTLRRHLPVLSIEETAELEQRPRTRGDCIDGPRPCPWVGCSMNLFVDVNGDGGIRFTYPELEEPDGMPARYSCALDIADRGGLGRLELAELLRVSPERIRQILDGSLSKLRSAPGLGGIAEEFGIRESREGDDVERREQPSAGEVEAAPPAESDPVESPPPAVPTNLEGEVVPEEKETSDMGVTNGAVTGAALHAAAGDVEDAEPTIAELVATIRDAEERLRAKRERHAAALAEIDGALGRASLTARVDALPGADDASLECFGDAPRRRPGRPTSTRRARIVEWLRGHPRSRTAEVARGVGGDSRQTAVILNSMRSSGQVTSSGPKGCLVWEAAP